MKRSRGDGNRPAKSTRTSNVSPAPGPQEVWVSPSSLWNYAHGDTLVDWLELMNRSTSSVAQPSTNGFAGWVMNQGVQFERRVVDLLKDKLGDQMMTLGECDWDDANAHTLAAMKTGAAVIYHGRLTDETRHTRGEPDLLVRADFLNTLFPGTIANSSVAPALGLPTHYVVVEIKYHTLMLRSNGRNLLSNPSSTYYKLQTQLYSQMLGKLQGYEPTSAYVLGRGYTYRHKGEVYSSPSAMARLGVIDFAGVDADISETLECAITWIRRLRTSGASWTLEPVPSVPELYPNMCVVGGRHAATKLSIAKRLHDITLLWYCGPKERARAHAAGIYGYDDPRLTTSVLGLKPTGVRTHIIDSMIAFHRAHATGRPMPVVIPSVLKGTRYNWREVPPIEFFVDFETFNNIFDDFSEFPVTTSKSMIFMIGLGWVVDDVFHYRHWHLRDLTQGALRDMINEFIEFVNYLAADRPANMYHWSSAEQTWLSKTVNEMTPSLTPSLCDLMKILTDDSVCIKDVFGYSLKNVAKGLAAVGKIPDMYGPLSGRCGDGMDAMVLAAECYRTGNLLSPRFASIIEYNKVDCKVMWEILSYLRRAH